jgi:hypothetical protein
VVGVTVGVDDRRDRAILDVLTNECERCGGGLGRRQWVDDDPPRLASDERHGREVEVADLVDAFDDLEQPAGSVELFLPPQARFTDGGASPSTKSKAAVSHTARRPSAVVTASGS